MNNDEHRRPNPAAAWARGFDRLLGPALVLLIVGLWVYTRFGSADPLAEMPRKVLDREERALYLVPAGRYTAADIASNQRKTASETFRGFKARHDMHPRPGDCLCPITGTKANPECTWTIDGREYQFCCPPCIDEFVRLAKQQPERLKPPEDYIR